LPSRRGVLACVLAGALALTPVPAVADDAPNGSEAAIQRGVELRRGGRNAEALVEFQKAFALDPSPRARAQVGLALQALGDWLGAERWLTDALQKSDDAWIARYRTDLTGALATIQAHLGSLVLHVDAEQGEVLVNGAPAGALPIRGPIRVVAGSIDVVVRAPGHVDAHRVIDVAAGAEVSETMALGPEVAPSAVPSSVATPPTDAEPHTRALIGGYVALGSAAALAIGGVVAWTVRQNAVGTWNDDTRCLRPGGGTRAQQCGAYQDTANVAFGLEIGAFSAAVGAWLLLRGAPAATSTAAWCRPGLLGLACGGEF